MYIQFNDTDKSIKASIKELIEAGRLSSWSFIEEEGRTRLMYTGDGGEYRDVVLRFMHSYSAGVERMKIVPSVAMGQSDATIAISHFGFVLSKFSGILNDFFVEIGSYVTVLSES